MPPTAFPLGMHLNQPPGDLAAGVGLSPEGRDQRRLPWLCLPQGRDRRAHSWLLSGLTGESNSNTHVQ